MKCRNCGKPAKKYTVKSKNGEIEVELCENCYKRLYAGGDDLFYERRSAVSKECSACGRTYEEFIRTGLFGCAECYKAFRAELIPVLHNFQGSVCHKGKVPVGAGEAYDEMRGLIAQQERLQTEIEEAKSQHDTAREEALRSRMADVRRKLRRTGV